MSKDNKDTLDYIVDAIKKRDEILIQKKSVSQYNKYYDIMCKYARKLIDSNRQDELLPYLECDNISFRFDVAGLLYNCYPEKCLEIFKEISNMSVKNGLPTYYSNIRLSSIFVLENGIPKDFP